MFNCIRNISWLNNNICDTWDKAERPLLLNRSRLGLKTGPGHPPPYQVGPLFINMLLISVANQEWTKGLYGQSSSASEWQFQAFIQCYLTATIELDQQQIKSLGNTSTAGHLDNIIGRKPCIPKYILNNHFIMYT